MYHMYKREIEAHFPGRKVGKAGMESKEFVARYIYIYIMFHHPFFGHFIQVCVRHYPGGSGGTGFIGSY